LKINCINNHIYTMQKIACSALIKIAIYLCVTRGFIV
jgi:hypothetical protein